MERVRAAGGIFFAALLFLVELHSVGGYARLVGCNRCLKDGCYLMHGDAVSHTKNPLGPKQALLTRGGKTLPCGTPVEGCERLGVNITRDESLLAVGDGDGLAFIFEVPDAVFLSRNVPDSSCRTRTDSLSATVIMPSNAQTVVLRAAFAYRHGQVYITDDCSYPVTPSPNATCSYPAEGQEREAPKSAVQETPPAPTPPKKSAVQETPPAPTPPKSAGSRSLGGGGAAQLWPGPAVLGAVLALTLALTRPG